MTTTTGLADSSRLIGVITSALAVALLAAHVLHGWSTAPRRADAESTVPSARSRRWIHGARPASRRGRTRRRTSRVHPTSVAAWLDDVARATRVGTSLSAAVVTPAPEPLGTHLRPLQFRLGTGDTVADAVDHWRAQLPPDESLLTAATVLVVADEVGGSIAVPLERAAALLRARAAEADERSGWAAQATLSARVLTGLPVAVLGVLLVVDRDVVEVIVSPLGAVIVAVGLLLDVTGFVWMRRIVARAES